MLIAFPGEVVVAVPGEVVTVGHRIEHLNVIVEQLTNSYAVHRAIPAWLASWPSGSSGSVAGPRDGIRLPRSQSGRKVHSDHRLGAQQLLDPFETVQEHGKEGGKPRDPRLVLQRSLAQPRAADGTSSAER